MTSLLKPRARKVRILASSGATRKYKSRPSCPPRKAPVLKSRGASESPQKSFKVGAEGPVPSPVKPWAIAYLVETRSGFPFSVQNDSGSVVGAVNAQRFPVFFELGLHVERRFAFQGHNWSWRAGVRMTGRAPNA